MAAGERLDHLEFKYYGHLGHPSLWRWLAIVNDIVDPLRIPLGTLLQIPPLSNIYQSSSGARTKEPGPEELR
jgi:hypothetical protein